jgi:hypothetical protein
MSVDALRTVTAHRLVNAHVKMMELNVHLIVQIVRGFVDAQRIVIVAMI